MGIWSSIFGPKPGEPLDPVEVQPAGLLMDADGWYYEETLDSQCPYRTIRVRQERPGNWYVRNTKCRIRELNDPARAAEVLAFFTGSFRWLSFEREEVDGCRLGSIAVFGTSLDHHGAEVVSRLGYLEPEIAIALVGEEVERMWGRIRCIRPPGRGRRPTFSLSFDLLIELDEKVFEEDTDGEDCCEDLRSSVH
jgi:hypothetical protein